MTRGAWARPALAVALCALLLAVLTGCAVDVGTELEVGAHGAGTFGVRLSFDREVQRVLDEQQPGGADVLLQEFLAAVPAGWAAEQGAGPDGARWVSAGVPFANLAQLRHLVALPAEATAGPVASAASAGPDPATAAAGEVAGGAAPGDPALEPRGLAALGLSDMEVRQETGLLWITTVFRAHVEGRALADRIAAEGLADLDPALLDGVVRVVQRVKLPGHVRAHNAAAREGGALVWRFDPGDDGDLRAESIAPRWEVLGPGLGVLGLLLVPGTLGLVRWRAARSRARRARERRRQTRFG